MVQTSLAIGVMLNDVVRKTISLSDGKTEIAALDWGGEGPLALLHHANGFCGAIWAGVADLLRDRFRVIAIDARGHGDSSPVVDMEHFGWSRLAFDLAEVAERILSDCGADRFALGLGHSFGGSLTTVVAARHPDFYQRIVLVDPVVFPPNIDIGSSRGSELAVRTRRRRRRWNSRKDAREFLAGKPLFESWDPGSLDLYIGEGLRDAEDGTVELKCAPEVEAEIFGGPHDIDLHAAADRLAVPALVLRATQGNFPLEVYVDWVARMKHGRLVDIEGGHLVPMEDPGRVAQVVLDECNTSTHGGS